jgi:hypothetical protein
MTRNRAGLAVAVPLAGLSASYCALLPLLAAYLHGGGAAPAANDMRLGLLYAVPALWAFAAGHRAATWHLPPAWPLLGIVATALAGAGVSLELSWRAHDGTGALAFALGFPAGGEPLLRIFARTALTVLAGLLPYAIAEVRSLARQHEASVFRAAGGPSLP